MKRVLIVVAIVLAGFGALAIRVVVEGRRAIATGDEAARQGRMTDAIAGWESAARWYLPFAPHVDDAYERLINLAKSEHTYALPAWRAVRSAALATRTLWTPHADDLITANAQIAELASRDPEGARAAGPDAAARKAWHTERLGRDAGPSRGGVFLAVLGLSAWLAGIGIVIRGPARIGAAVTVLGLIGWMIGLAVA